MSQVVDTESAKEFMKEAFSKISPEELNDICVKLEVKHQIFQKHLNDKTIENLTEEQIFKILRNIFSTRRKAQNLMENYTADNLRSWIQELLFAKMPLSERFQSFYDRLEGLESNIRFDLASELLHFTFPNQYWLWTRWMWDPKVRTGALPLVITQDYELNGDTIGDTYLNVGQAVTFVHEVGEAAGFQVISHNLFGTDVYLSCVYVIYVYTVLRMRMTQEFNKVMPGLKEFVCRLLGVYKLE